MDFTTIAMPTCTKASFIHGNCFQDFRYLHMAIQILDNLKMQASRPSHINKVQKGRNMEKFMPYLSF